MQTATRDLAITFNRARAILGLGLLLVPGALGRAWLGRGSGAPAARAGLRMMGARDVVLGVGGLTAIKEGAHGPEWMSMAAVADGVDAAVCLVSPGIPKRARVVGLIAAAAAVLGLRLARDLADEREAARLAEEQALAASAAGAPGAVSA